jgi:uncharacterized protein (DUF697 family)
MMLAREYCKDLVSRYAAGAGVGSLVPIPGTSLAITAAEVKLVVDIARAYGETLTDHEALRVIALSGVKNVGVKAVGEAAAYLPVVGWLARPALFAASVKAVGDAVIDHFETRHPLAHSRAS